VKKYETLHQKEPNATGFPECHMRVPQRGSEDGGNLSLYLRTSPMARILTLEDTQSHLLLVLSQGNMEFNPQMKIACS
jgi:hypothetical protein